MVSVMKRLRPSSAFRSVRSGAVCTGLVSTFASGLRGLFSRRNPRRNPLATGADRRIEAEAARKDRRVARGPSFPRP